MQWAADTLPAFETRLSAPPQHEWLELVKYWNGGGRAPVWFVTDQVRTDIDLVQHPAPTDYRWGLPYPTLLSGTRPGELRWLRIERPEWYLGEGWSLTPEVAGVATADKRGLSAGSIGGWIHADVLQGGEEGTSNLPSNPCSRCRSAQRRSRR
jgi:hypothetical protein